MRRRKSETLAKVREAVLVQTIKSDLISSQVCPTGQYVSFWGGRDRLQSHRTIPVQVRKAVIRPIALPIELLAHPRMARQDSNPQPTGV